MSLNDTVGVPSHSGRWASRPKASANNNYVDSNTMSKTLQANIHANKFVSETEKDKSEQ